MSDADDIPVHASNDYLTILGPNEAAVIQEATAFIRRVLPANELERNAYGLRNLELQDLLNNLRANVDHSRNRRFARLCQREKVLLASARDDRITAREERQVHCYGDNIWRDDKAVVDQLTIVSRRLDAIEWALKSALTLIGRR